MPEPSDDRSALDRVFVALDVERLDEADSLLERLDGAMGGCKIGSQLFTAAGPLAIEHALKRGYRVFLDLKYHDIPNTVTGAVREATRLGVFMLNVHASGGAAMMRGRRAQRRKPPATSACSGRSVSASPCSRAWIVGRWRPRWAWREPFTRTCCGWPSGRARRDSTGAWRHRRRSGCSAVRSGVSGSS